MASPLLLTDGLSADEQARLFEPFVTTRAEGTGLGLALSRQIARDHHGELRAESVSPAEGGGARFTLTLPRHAVEGP